VKFHESFCLDSQQDQLLWFDDFLGDQVQDEWRDVGNGSAIVVDQQTGGIVRITSGAVSENNHQIDWQDIRSLHVNQRISMEFRLKLTQTTNTRTFNSLFFDANNRVDFRYDSGVSNNWFIRCMDGGASTLLDAGVAADTSYHIFRIECFPTGEVHFFIDGTETANSPINTNIPDDAADFLQPRFWIRTLENLDKSMDIDYVVVRQDV